jgi:hypothetical protein
LARLVYAAAVGGALNACIDWDTLSPPSRSAPDAGPDAPMIDGSSPPRACSDAGVFALCDDFDQGLLGDRWSEVVIGGGGVLETIPRAALSPPNALSARSTITGTGLGNAYLKKELGKSADRIDFAFALRIEATGPAYAEFASIFLTVPPDQRYALAFRALPSGQLAVLEVADDARGSTVLRDVTFARSPAVDRWARFRVSVTLRPTGSLRVVMDDAVSVVDVPITPSVLDGLRNVALGLTYFTSGGWKVLVEDVTCEIGP